MSKRLILTGLVLAGALGASTASATVIPSPLAIDFRTPAWAGAADQSSWAVGPVLTTALPPGNRIYQDVEDGLGIVGGNENDELDLFEMLRVDITGGMPLCGIWITDLYAAPDGGVGERGKVVINGLLTFSFDGNLSDQANGEQFVSFGGEIPVTSALFYVDNLVPGIDRGNNDYSVAGFGGTCPPPEIPEPASLLLLGAALAGAGLRRRVR